MPRLQAAVRAVQDALSRYVVLLRGVNVGGRNPVPMGELRTALAHAGFEDVRTYLQSGNVLLGSTAERDALARRCERVINRRFGLDIAVVVRTLSELAAVVRRDPLGHVAADPKRYLVAFLAAKPGRALEQKLELAAADQERVVVAGKQIYAWLPDGIGRSRLWALLASRDLGITATARNWTTVTKLVELSRGPAPTA